MLVKQQSGSEWEAWRFCTRVQVHALRVQACDWEERPLKRALKIRTRARILGWERRASEARARRPVVEGRLGQELGFLGFHPITASCFVVLLG